MDTMSSRLKDLRTRRNWSQQYVASKLGVGRTTYVKYENGTANPVNKLQQLADLFGVTTDYLLNGSVKAEQQSLKDGYFSDGLLEAAVRTPEGRKQLAKIIEKTILNPPAPESVNTRIIDKVYLENGQITCDYSKNSEDYVVVNGRARDNIVTGETSRFHGDIVFNGSTISGANPLSKGSIAAIFCRGDYMKDLGIDDGDVAVIRLQQRIESGALAVVIVGDEDGILQRVQVFDEGVMLESANPKYPTRVFSGESLAKIIIVGKVLEVRKRF